MGVLGSEFREGGKGRKGRKEGRKIVKTTPRLRGRSVASVPGGREGKEANTETRSSKRFSKPSSKHVLKSFTKFIDIAV